MPADETSHRLPASEDRLTIFERVASLVTLGGGGSVLYGIIVPEASSLVLVGGASAFFAGVASLALATIRRRSP